MVLSTSSVEIFNNAFVNNNFANVIISSYLIFRDFPDDIFYGPFPERVHIHDNDYTLTGTVDVVNQKPLIQQLMGVLGLYSLPQPNILVDGIILRPTDICIQEAADVSFTNLNASDPTFASVTTDASSHNCSNEPLPEISFTPF